MAEKTSSNAGFTEPRILNVSHDAVTIRDAELTLTGEPPLLLRAFDPKPGRFWISPRRFYFGRYLLILALILLTISGELGLIGNPFWIAAEVAVGLCGLVLIFARKLLLLAQFKSTDGSLTLNIVRSGMDSPAFEHFVDNLSDQIKTVRDGFRL